MTMPISGGLRAGPRKWMIATTVVILTGCVGPPGNSTSGEPTMTPITGRITDPAQTGQQGASLQLTEEGRQFIASGHLDEAASIFQKAISLYPSNPYAYYYLGQARYLEKNYDQALTPLRQAELYLAGDSVWTARVFALRGQVYEGQSKHDEARQQYEKALSLDYRNLDARDGLDRIENLPPPTE